VCIIDEVSLRSSVVSSAYCESLMSVVELGGRSPLMSVLARMVIARISAVTIYSGIDKAQPCRRPLPKGMKAVSHPLTLTELETEL